MKNMLSLIDNGTIELDDLEGIGWSEDGAIEAAVESVVDKFRFADETDRVLARVEGEQGYALFPPAAELKRRGVDILALAIALEANQLEPCGFADTLASQSVATINEALAHLNEHAAFTAVHPTPEERAMHLWGECGCNMR